MALYKQVAVESVKEAGKLLLNLSKSDIKYQMKGSHDILAEGDLNSEKIIINKIKSNFPDHGILSEEQGQDSNKSQFLWIIDPIDGTINFARHIEEYCVSIALSHKGQIILGVIYQPALNKLFIAEKGQGAFLNDKKITVSSENKLINSLVATDNSSKIEARTDIFNILSKISSEVRHIRIFGSSALHLARIAEGQLDFYYKSHFNYWDFAAGMQILKEAGGKITNFEGGKIAKDSKNIVATNGILHRQALEIINR